MIKVWQKLKGFGLVESLVALAIFGTAILGATKVTINSLKIINESEIADFANGIMVQTLEYTRQPGFDYLVDQPGAGNIRYFRLDGNISTQDTTGMTVVPLTTAQASWFIEGIDEEDCRNSNNPYKVNIVDNKLKNITVCSQVMINVDNGLAKARLVYFNAAGEVSIVELKGFVYKDL